MKSIWGNIDVMWSTKKSYGYKHICHCKSPCLDGFNMAFYKTAWEIMKLELWECVNELFLTTHLLNDFTVAFISLIPKSHNPQNLNEFRPICLIGNAYRIISKFLTSILKQVTGKLVSSK